MSFYVKVLQASTFYRDSSKKLVLVIRGRSSQLKAHTLPQYSKPTWNVRFVCSNKQRMLTLTLVDSQSQKIISQGQLYLSPYLCMFEKQLKQSFSMSNNVTLQLEIFYTKRKNYIGSLQFYEFSNFVPHQSSMLRFSTLSDKLLSPNSKKSHIPVALRHSAAIKPQESNFKQSNLPSQSYVAPEFKDKTVQPKKSRGFFDFFCCGQQDVDDKRFQIQQDDRTLKNVPNDIGKTLAQSQVQKSPKVQFYKGGCASKNLFSACDNGTKDQKFTVVQDYYRDS